jgi:hypothetical protein
MYNIKAFENFMRNSEFIPQILSVNPKGILQNVNSCRKFKQKKNQMHFLFNIKYKPIKVVMIAIITS